MSQKSISPTYSSTHYSDTSHPQHKSTMLASLLSVVGAGMSETYFYQNTPSSSLPKQSTHSDLETITTQPRPTSPTSTPSLLQQKIRSLIAQELQTNFRSPTHELNQTIQRLQKQIHDLELTILKNKTSSSLPHPQLTPANKSITIQKNTIAVNPSGIPFATTINGGIVTNLKDFMQVTSIALNSITSLGGVNEGVNEATKDAKNPAELFHKKTGTRFFFRTLYSSDSSIRFTPTQDGKSIDATLSLESHLRNLPKDSVSADAIQKDAVTLEKIANKNTSVLLGASELSPTITTLKLDTNSLILQDSVLRVKTGKNGLHLHQLDGKITYSQLPDIPAYTLLANATPNTASASALHFDPAVFGITTAQGIPQLGFSREFYHQIQSPFVQTHNYITLRTPESKLIIGAYPQDHAQSKVTIYANSSAFSLIGTDQVHQHFYPQGIHSTTHAALGFCETHTNNFLVQNSSPNGSIQLKSDKGVFMADGSDLHFTPTNTRSGALVFHNSVYPDYTAEVARIYTTATPDSSTLFFATGTTPTARIAINTEGQVGIGTYIHSDYLVALGGNTRILGGLTLSHSTGVKTDPNIALTIAENTHQTGISPTLVFSDGSGTNASVQYKDNSLVFQTDATTSLPLQASAFLSYKGLLEEGNGFQFVDEKHARKSGMFLSKEGKLHLTNSAHPSITVAENGNVGVQTQKPKAQLDVHGTTRTQHLQITDTLLVGKHANQAGQYGEVLTSQGKGKPMIWKSGPSTLLTESGIRLVHPANGKLFSIAIEEPQTFWKSGKTIRVKMAGLGEPGSHIQWKFGIADTMCTEYWSANHTPFYGFPHNSTHPSMMITSSGINPMWSIELIIIYQGGIIKGVLQYNTTQNKNNHEAPNNFGQYVFELPYLPAEHSERLHLNYTTGLADTTIWYTLVESLN